MATKTEPKKRPKYVDIEGFRLDDGFIKSRVISAMKYEPLDGDIFVATYPKCGTTWMCHIVLLILRRGNEPTTTDEYFSCCPFMELTGAEPVLSRSKPGCIKTHFPFDRIQFSKHAKYIYVARHPRDCVVSFYHHTKLFPNYYFTDGTFEDFFEIFIRGETDFNDYFDNLLSWYEHKSEPNLLFVTFESMKADHKGTVLKVAEFLGPEHYQAVTENGGELLDKIIELSSFRHMKEVIDPMFMEAFLQVPEDLSNFEDDIRESWENIKKAKESGEVSVGTFIRKGVVGDGKITLTAEQEIRLKERIEEKTKGTDVMSLWNK